MLTIYTVAHTSTSIKSNTCHTFFCNYEFFFHYAFLRIAFVVLDLMDEGCGIKII